MTDANDAFENIEQSVQDIEKAVRGIQQSVQKVEAAIKDNWKSIWVALVIDLAMVSSRGFVARQMALRSRL